jgi:hypothetical protein
MRDRGENDVPWGMVILAMTIILVLFVVWLYA